jgi:hypothetical protein
MPSPRRSLAWITCALVLTTPTLARAERVVFLNLEQQAINNANGNDPTLDSYSTNGFAPGTIDGYPALDEDQRAELMHWFKQATVPFDIHFTYERPAAGTYDMLVFGSEADNTALFPGLGCSASIGLADCDDANGPNISFMFWGCMPDDQQMDLRRVAFFGLTGLGFGFGLENVGVSGQVMGTYSQTALRFGDSCVDIEGAAMCTHAGCGASQQNSSADLEPNVGARIDDGPPTVTIESPANFAIVDPNVAVVATVDDAFGGVSVALEIVEAAQMLDDDVPPHTWGLENIPDGQWTLRVTATDADDNVTTAEVVICVGADVGVCGAGSDTGGDTTTTGADETTSSSGADTTTGGDETTTTTGDEGTGADPVTTASSTVGVSGTGFAGGDPATGCACASASSTGGGLELAVCGVVVLGLARRRRR